MNTLRSLNVPPLVGDDPQNTSTQSPFIIPTMNEEGAALNTGSPLSEYNAGLSEWFGSEEKEQSGEQPKDQPVMPASPNYTGMIIAGGVILIGLLLIFRKGGS